MCTITTQKKAIKIKEDIQSFKKVLILGSGFNIAIMSPYQKYKHKVNQIDSAKITFSRRDEGEFVCLDEKEVDNFYQPDTIYKSFTSRNPLPEYVGKLRAVSTGFHSCLTADRIREVSRYEIVKCIIPKGSSVYYGSDGLIVSNRIIVTDEKV